VRLLNAIKIENINEARVLAIKTTKKEVVYTTSFTMTLKLNRCATKKGI